MESGEVAEGVGGELTGEAHAGEAELGDGVGGADYSGP